MGILMKVGKFALVNAFPVVKFFFLKKELSRMFHNKKKNNSLFEDDLHSIGEMVDLFIGSLPTKLAAKALIKLNASKGKLDKLNFEIDEETKSLVVLSDSLKVLVKGKKK
tara:strand:- start:38 stop:367 length:330 start_codon:yes stop_codon:yes gene_type:complete